MLAEIPDEFKMFLEPRLLEHIVRVAANGEYLSSLHVVVIVQGPPGLKPRDGALVNDGLPVILAKGFEGIQLHQAVGRGEEFQVFVAAPLDGILHLLVVDGNWRVLDEPRILEAALFGEVVEVVPVEGAAEALAPEHLIVTKRLGHASIGVYVGEVELPTLLEEAVAAPQHRLLIGTEVDDTIGDDDVDAAVLERVDVVQFFNEPLVEFYVVVAEFVGVVGLVFPRGIELFLGHVDADDSAIGPDELGGDVDVSAGPAAQVEDGRAVEEVGGAEAASVVLGDDGGVDLLDAGFDGGVGHVGRAAGVGFEVGGGGEGLAVVVRDGGVGVRFVHCRIGLEFGT